MPNAPVKIDSSIKVTRRLWGEPYLPTEINTHAWGWDTDLDGYHNVTTDAAQTVYDHVLAEKSTGGICTVHVAVRIANVTHPEPGKGVVVLPKGHRDLAIDDLSLTSYTVIEKQMNEAIEWLKTIAKY